MSTCFTSAAGLLPGCSTATTRYAFPSAATRVGRPGGISTGSIRMTTAVAFGVTRKAPLSPEIPHRKHPRSRQGRLVVLCKSRRWMQVAIRLRRQRTIGVDCRGSSAGDDVDHEQHPAKVGGSTQEAAHCEAAHDRPSQMLLANR
jgi:hypothetical protein